MTDWVHVTDDEGQEWMSPKQAMMKILSETDDPDGSHKIMQVQHPSGKVLVVHARRDEVPSED